MSARACDVAVIPDEQVTLDTLYTGRVKIYQPVRGFRACTDSLLLAAALDAGACGQGLDIGCGAGGALLPAAFRLTHMRFTGLEQDPVLAGLARRGAVGNGFANRVETIIGDAANLPLAWQNRFDLVFSNPPFFETGSIQQPGQNKEQAYVETLSLEGWIGAMLFALRPKGVWVMIHRAASLARVLSVLERRAGDIAIMPIRNWPGADAKRVIIRARKGLRPGPARLLAGYDLYTKPAGKRTKTAHNVQTDGTGLDWSLVQPDACRDGRVGLGNGCNLQPEGGAV